MEKRVTIVLDEGIINLVSNNRLIRFAIILLKIFFGKLRFLYKQKYRVFN